jgi:hypothetical protein
MLRIPSTTLRSACFARVPVNCTQRMVDGVVHSDHECAAQLKAIVGQYARVLYERVGADAFGQECSLLDGKGAWRLQFVQSRRRSYTSR